MLNGIAAVGLLYLVVILLAFNWQYMRLTVHAAGVAASTLGLDVLPPRVMAQLYATMLLRCLLVGMFFTFTIVYFFPYSGECSTTLHGRDHIFWTFTGYSFICSSEHVPPGWLM